MEITSTQINAFLQQSLFYFFAALAIVSALFMIVAKNPVRSVLSLIVTFFAMGALWILLRAEFLAMTLVLVYVGAVMVLFMFVIMMLDIEYATINSGFTRYLPIGLCVSVLVAVGIIHAVGPQNFGLEHFLPPSTSSSSTVSQPLGVHTSADHRSVAPMPPASPVTRLGSLLYSQYLYPFEIAGILLLVAIIAAISLTFRGRQHRKTQDPDEQVAVQKKDRLRIISKMGPMGPGLDVEIGPISTSRPGPIGPTEAT